MLAPEALGHDVGTRPALTGGAPLTGHTSGWVSSNLDFVVATQMPQPALEKAIEDSRLSLDCKGHRGGCDLTIPKAEPWPPKAGPAAC